MMNTSILPSSFVKELEFSKEDLRSHVASGIITKMDSHKEHFAIQPCWLQDPGAGVMEEINNGVLGRWNNKLKAYVVCIENIRNYEKSAGMNEDHKWLHVDIRATYYIYNPTEGQHLKGEVKKIGKTAAVCILFDVFTATVFAKNQFELRNWTVGQEIQFEVTSFQHRRKGPIIRARSVAQSQSSFQMTPRKRKFSDSSEELESVEIVVESVDIKQPVDDSGIGKKKKSKRNKSPEIQDRLDSTVSNNDNGIESEELSVGLHSRSKKEKKSKRNKSQEHQDLLDSMLSNTDNGIESDEPSIGLHYSRSKKGKKSKRNKSQENPDLLDSTVPNIDNAIESDEPSIDLHSRSKKKKKKKSRDQES